MDDTEWEEGERGASVSSNHRQIKFFKNINCDEKHVADMESEMASEAAKTKDMTTDTIVEQLILFVAKTSNRPIVEKATYFLPESYSTGGRILKYSEATPAQKKKIVKVVR